MQSRDLQMARDDFIALCAESLALATEAGFGWLLAPKSAELKLAKT